MYTSSRFVFNVNKQEFYKFQVENPGLDILIKTMQRSYGGSFTEPVPVYEAELGRRLDTSEQVIKDLLNKMQQLEILSYFPVSDKPQLSFTSELVKPEHLTISPENYKIRRADALTGTNHWLIMLPLLTSAEARC
jgi:ATP-dependent DNA helicase RecQ